MHGVHIYMYATEHKKLLTTTYLQTPIVKPFVDQEMTIITQRISDVGERLNVFVLVISKVTDDGPTKFLNQQKPTNQKS